MLDITPVLNVIGIIVSAFALFMFIPAIVEYYDSSELWKIFCYSGAITLFIGILLWLIGRSGRRGLNIRQSFVMIVGGYFTLAFFAALPLYLGLPGFGIVNALFEGTSGITTTGSTVIEGLDELPRGILLWRSCLEWLGGIGVISIAISVLPVLGIGGMEIFKIEFFEAYEKDRPRLALIIRDIVTFYLCITIVCMVSYRLAGMSWFDAVNHALTTVSTGGFSTHDKSIGFYDSLHIEIVSIVFIIIMSLPLFMLVRLFRGRYRSLFTDTQSRLFISLLCIITAVVSMYRWLSSGQSYWASLRESVFNVVSIMTGTGYATASYDSWGVFAICIFLFIGFLGGCAVSTTCGITIFRFVVLFKLVWVQIRQMFSPNGVFLAKYNKNTLPVSVTSSVTVFFFVFIGTYVLSVLSLAMLGTDLITSLSSSATAIANVGPGLGNIVGPSGTFGSLSDSVKVVLTLTMLVGRLEVISVLVILMPSFWRN